MELIAKKKASPHQIMQEGQIRLACSRGQFPVKLYAILELADKRGPSGCSWLPHGRAFRIDDERDFMRAWAPVFFKQTKIRSFHRQLYLWGFKRSSMGTAGDAWHNEFFVRGKPEEMKKMVRVRNKGKAGQGHRSGKMEPGSSGVSTELELVSTAPAPAREFQLKCSRTAGPEEPGLPSPETAGASSPAGTSSIPTTARTRPLIILNQEKQCPLMDFFQPWRAGRDAPSPDVSSGAEDAEFRLTDRLEPLPFKSETASPSTNATEGRTKSRSKPSPIDDGMPLDDFSSYIDDTIQIL